MSTLGGLLLRAIHVPRRCAWEPAWPLGPAFKALENCIPEAGLVYCSVSQ